MTDVTIDWPICFKPVVFQMTYCMFKTLTQLKLNEYPSFVDSGNEKYTRVDFVSGCLQCCGTF